MMNVQNMQIRFRHLHPRDELDRETYYQLVAENDLTPEMVKAATVCTLCTEDGSVINRGIAFTSEHDNFCRAIGRKKSMARALKMLSRDARTEIWDTYFENHKA